MSNYFHLLLYGSFLIEFVKFSLKRFISLLEQAIFNFELINLLRHESLNLFLILIVISFESTSISPVRIQTETTQIEILKFKIVILYLRFEALVMNLMILGRKTTVYLSLVS